MYPPLPLAPEASPSPCPARTASPTAAGLARKGLVKFSLECWAGLLDAACPGPATAAGLAPAGGADFFPTPVLKGCPAAEGFRGVRGPGVRGMMRGASPVAKKNVTKSALSQTAALVGAAYLLPHWPPASGGRGVAHARIGEGRQKLSRGL